MIHLQFAWRQYRGLASMIILSSDPREYLIAA